MSKEPIFNEITVYGTYMNPSTGVLQTRIPVPDYGFLSFDPNRLRSFELLDFVVSVKASLPNHLSITSKVCFKCNFCLSLSFQPPLLKQCKNCAQIFDLSINKKGQCSHSGSWHDSFGDCNVITCGFGLGPSGIGLQVEDNLLVKTYIYSIGDVVRLLISPILFARSPAATKLCIELLSCLIYRKTSIDLGQLPNREGLSCNLLPVLRTR